VVGPHSTPNNCKAPVKFYWKESLGAAKERVVAFGQMAQNP
jgi:hypothetical protein